MLCKALQENDTGHVLVDILTFADLEILRARKRGELLPINAAVQAGNSSSGASVAGTVHTTSAGNNKRYIILTYINDFDKVHYPLSLMFEGSKPNSESMKRTIRELRGRLSASELRASTLQHDHSHSHSQAHSHGSQSDSAQLQANRQLISKLRQDNVHLQQQVKQLQHSAKTVSSPQTNSRSYSKSASALQYQMNQQIQQHVAENDALMKKYLELKKEKAVLAVQLDELSKSYEKQRKEVVIWKVKYDKVIKAPSGEGVGYTSRQDANSSRAKDERIHQLEQQLAQERADFRRKLAGAVPQNPWRGRDTKPRVDSSFSGRGRGIVNKYDNVKSSNYGTSRARSYTPPARRGASPAGPHKPFDPTAYTREKEAKRQQMLADRAKRQQAASSRRQFYDDGYSSTGSARSDRSGRSTISSRSGASYGSRNSERPGYASDTSSTSRRSARSTGSNGSARGGVNSSTTRRREPSHGSSSSASTGSTNRKSRLAGEEKQGNNRMYSGDGSKVRSHGATSSAHDRGGSSFVRTGTASGSGSRGGIAAASILGTEAESASPARKYQHKHQHGRFDDKKQDHGMLLTGHNLSSHKLNTSQQALSEVDASPGTRVLNQLSDQNESQLSSIEQISMKIAQMSTFHNQPSGGVSGSAVAVPSTDNFEYSEDFAEQDATVPSAPPALAPSSRMPSSIVTAAGGSTPRSSIDTSSFSTTSSPWRHGKPAVVTNNYTTSVPSSPARQPINNFMSSSPTRHSQPAYASSPGRQLSNASPARQSASSSSVPEGGGEGEGLGNDLDAIDKRIQVLSAYLDKAR